MTEWTDFERRFRRAVAQASARRRFDAEYADRCLSYAKTLHDRGLPIIFDQQHFALLVGYTLDFVRSAANAPRKFYRRLEIQKRSGGTRVLREPLPSLKSIQRWILDNILAPLPVHRFAKGFVRGRSIRDNARFHVRQKAVLKLDIRDFFGSISHHRVVALFLSCGYSPEVSVLLARLCTFDDGLPQGAPTSPAISNLICQRVDARIAGYAKSQRVRFTRYADDLTFSGALSVGDIISFVEMVLREEGLELNSTKTRLMERHERQEVTGIVVNDTLNAPREVRRELRQVAHYVEKFGLDSHLQQTRNLKSGFVRHAMGLATFVLFLNPNDRDALRLLEVLRPLVRTSY